MSDGVGKRVRKNTGLMLGAKGIGAVMAAFGIFFAVQGLSVEEFGLLVFMHAYILFFTEVATFDSWLVMVRHAAGGLTGDEAERNDPARFGRVARFCSSLDLLSASVGFIVAITLAYVLSGFIPILQYATPFLFFYCLLIFLNQKSASLGVLRLFDRFDLVAMNSLTIPFTRMAGCAIAWALGAPFWVYMAVWFAGSAISYLTLPVLAYFELKRRELWAAATDGRLTLTAPEPKVWRFVMYTNIDTAIAAGAAQLPLLLAGAVGGAGFAAIFRIAQEVAIVLAKGAVMIDRVVYPEFTNLIAKGEGARVPGYVLRTGGAMFAVGAVIGAIVWFGGPYVLNWALGPEYVKAASLAVLLILGASLTAAAGPLFPAFYAAGKPKKAIFSRLSGLSVMVIGFFALYHTVGQIGPGFAVMSGALVSLLVAVYVARLHDWSASKAAQGHTDLSVSRTSAGDSSAEADKTGGPGQPGSSSGRSSE